MGTAGSVPRIAWVIHAGVDGATHGRSRPVSSIAAARGLTFLGLDVHRDTISVAVLGPGREEAPTVDRIANDEPSIRRLVGRFGDPRRLRACYAAGPTGDELARLLDRLEIRCQVIAPMGCLPTWPQLGSRHEQPALSTAAWRSPEPGWRPVRWGGGSGVAGPGCRGRHSQRRRRATATAAAKPAASASAVVLAQGVPSLEAPASQHRWVTSYGVDAVPRVRR